MDTRRRARQLLGPTRIVALLAVMASAAAAPGCAGRAAHHTRETELPPAEVLRLSFEQAQLVAEVEVQTVTAARAFPDDEGRPGYVCYLVQAVVVANHKGELAVSQPVSYRFTQEQDADTVAYPRPGSQMLVFLKPASEDGRLWLIGEGGQLETDPRLSRLVSELSSSH